MIKRNILALGALAVCLPELAMAQVQAGDSLGTTSTAIMDGLEAQGYQVNTLAQASGMFRVEARINGVLTTILVDANTGLVVQIGAAAANYGSGGEDDGEDDGSGEGEGDDD